MNRTISHSDYLSGAAIHDELTIPQLLEKSSFLLTIEKERGRWGGWVLIPVLKESNRPSILGQIKTNVHSNKIFNIYFNIIIYPSLRPAKWSLL